MDKKEYLSELEKQLEMIPLTFNPVFKGGFDKDLIQEITDLTLEQIEFIKDGKME